MLARRLASSLFTLVVLAACSAKAPTPPGSSDSATPGRPAPAGAPAATAQPADPRERVLVAAILGLLERHHVKARPFDDEMSALAFERYAERLDPSKLFLLASDVAELRRHERRIDDQLDAGQLELAHAGAARYRQRLEFVRGAVAELLGAPMDLENDETLELDADRLQHAASEAELRDRWRQRLELEVLERVAAMERRLASQAAKAGAPAAPGAGRAGEAAPAADEDADADGLPAMKPEDIPATVELRQAKARAQLAERYAARFARLASSDALDAAAELLAAVTSVYDPHTVFMPPADEANFDINMSGSLEGIGAVLQEHDHYIRVSEVVVGGAGWRDGRLEAGDLVLAVAQDGADPVDVADMRIDEVVRMIRGPKGTVVHLTVQKATGDVVAISITRDVVVLEEAYARGALVTPEPKGGTYGYVYLPSFYGGDGARRTAAGDVRRLLRALRDAKVRGVVLDLRGNGGGLLGDSVELTGELIDRGPVVQTADGDGAAEVLADDVPGVAYDGPVVVMVDASSASAAEIVAAALQDYGRAVVVGTGPTHGKGTVQVLIDLDQLARQADPLGVLKLTTQQFYRVTGASTQWRGVTPDVLLPDAQAFAETGERELDSSLPWSEIAPVAFTPSAKAWDLAALQRASAARVAASDAFAAVGRLRAVLQARRDETTVPLRREAFLARRAEQRAQLEAATPDFERGARRSTVAPLPGGAADDRGRAWRDRVARDPWVEEAMLVLRDMATPARRKR